MGDKTAVTTFSYAKGKRWDSMNKRIALMGILILLLTPLVTFQPTIVNAQSSNQAPALAWQQNYDNYFNSTGNYFNNSGVEAVSNLIQTNDGGYAFMDDGWGFQDTFVPATVYKVSSLGNVNWTKTIDNFAGTAIKQTSDGGLEVSGNWGNYELPPHVQYPTVIKMDSDGNIESNKNYSNVPNLGGTSSSVGKIRVSDGGFVYWTGGSIIRTASNNSTQWVLNLNYTLPYGYAPTLPASLTVSSVIETSDGALAILIVGYFASDIPMSGNIYLVKTEAFLPPPTNTNLPTLSIALASSVAVVVMVVLSLVFYRRRIRKTANLKQ